ncbi:MAG: ABC transporter permease, partial [Candidatus Caldatribacterium sp.]|nr:ABC transporter permease [Candidatus Caldatribacterium sp.]
MRNRWLSENRTQVSILFVLCALLLLFTISSPRTFLSGDIYTAFMSTLPFSMIMALSLTLVVICGEMDLSFPSIMGFCGYVFAQVFHATGSVAFALFVCILVGLVAGYINGFLVVKFNLPSLVVTIGTQFFWAGLT